MAAPVVGKAIVDFHLSHPLEGYRRLAFMMLDRDVVAVSPSSVWRVLGQAGLRSRWNARPSKKGTGFVPPPDHERSTMVSLIAEALIKGAGQPG